VKLLPTETNVDFQSGLTVLSSNSSRPARAVFGSSLCVVLMFHPRRLRLSCSSSSCLFFWSASSYECFMRMVGFCSFEIRPVNSKLLNDSAKKDSNSDAKRTSRMVFCSSCNDGFVFGIIWSNRRGSNQNESNFRTDGCRVSCCASCWGGGISKTYSNKIYIDQNLQKDVESFTCHVQCCFPLFAAEMPSSDVVGSNF